MDMIEDYLSEEDKKRIAEGAFREVCRKRAQEDFERIITNSAYDVVWRAVDECFDRDVEEFLKEEVLRILSDMSEFNVFRRPNAWDRVANSPYETLCEVVKANKDLLDVKIKQSIGSLTKKDMKEVAMKLVEDRLV